MAAGEQVFDTVVRMRRVREIVGLGKTTVYDLIKAGEFPPGIKLGKRTRGWRTSDLQEWLKTREARHLAG